MEIYNDKSVSVLDRLGYDMVRLASTFIKPLDLLIPDSMKEGLERLGNKQNCSESDLELPKLIDDLSPDINSIETEELNSDIGLSALVDIIHVKGTLASNKINKNVRHNPNFIASETTDSFAVEGTRKKSSVKNGIISYEQEVAAVLEIRSSKIYYEYGWKVLIPDITKQYLSDDHFMLGNSQLQEFLS